MQEHSGRVLIEVCVDSVESAIAAVRGGADRIELCANLGLGGGTTPSAGLLKLVQTAIPGTPIMAMVRPRTGDFLYSEAELNVMLEDIQSFKQSGVAGVVFGVLTKQGTVDLERTKKLMSAAYPLEVCFHRAFDLTRDATEALIDILSLPGVTRILTSGQGKTAPSSLEVLTSLFVSARSHTRPDTSERAVTILPGSGINAATVKNMCDTLIPLGLSEVHLSGGRWMDGDMAYRPDGMGMGVGGPGDWSIWRTDEEAIRRVRTILDGIERGSRAC